MYFCRLKIGNKMFNSNEKKMIGFIRAVIFVMFLFRFCDLYGQIQNVESLTIEQYLKLADEKQQEENVRDASLFLNAAAEKSWEAKDYQNAIEYYNRSIKLNETVSNFNGIAGINCNLGLIYFDIGEYENSYEFLKKSYQYRKEKNEKFAIISQLINISVTLNKMKRYDESIAALEEGVSVARDLNDYEQMRSCYGMLSETYTKAGNTEMAAEYFHMYKTVHDALSKESEKRHETELSEATVRAQLAEMKRELAEARERYADYELSEMSKAYEGLDSTNRALLEGKTKAELIIDILQANKKNAELEKKKIEERFKAERLKARNLIVGLCATVLIVVIIGFLLWQKKKDNQKLEKQNAFIMQAQKELDEYQEKLEESVAARTSALMKLLDQSRESDRLKSSFFSNMSHEIRTPLNAILGFSQMLYNPNVSDEKRAMMSYLVKSNSEQLLKMIEDIVTLSEIDSGIIMIQPRKYDIRKMLQEAFAAAIETAKSIGNDQLEIILDDRLTETMEEVLVDGKKISRILMHLIDNAIKNTNSGYVMFGCEDLPEEKMLRFWVEDTGTGIEEKDFENIYKRFWKHGEVLTQKFRGLGIGLSFCKELLEIMEGKISLTTEVGQGSTFSFTVKYKNQNKHEE